MSDCDRFKPVFKINEDNKEIEKLNSDHLCGLIWNRSPFIINFQINKEWEKYITFNTNNKYADSWSVSFDIIATPLLINLLKTPSSFLQLPFYLACRAGNFHLIEFLCKIPELLSQINSSFTSKNNSMTIDRSGKNFLHGLYWKSDGKKNLIDVFKITNFFINHTKINYEFFLKKADDDGETPLKLLKKAIYDNLPYTFDVKDDIFDPSTNVTLKIQEHCEYIQKLNEIFEELKKKYSGELIIISNIKSKKIDKIYLKFIKEHGDDISKIKDLNENEKLYKEKKKTFTMSHILTRKQFQKRVTDELIIMQQTGCKSSDPMIKEMINLGILKNQIDEERYNIVNKYKNSFSEDTKKEIIISNFKEVLLIKKDDKLICELLKGSQIINQFLYQSEQKKGWFKILTYRM